MRLSEVGQGLKLLGGRRYEDWVRFSEDGRGRKRYDLGLDRPKYPRLCYLILDNSCLL